MWPEAVLVFSLFAAVCGNVVKRQAVSPCYRNHQWHATGRGFLAVEDDCTSYLECWKVFGSDTVSQPVRRQCPINTMVVNTNAIRGSPCGHCDTAICPQCARDHTTIEIILDCPYIQMVPASVWGIQGDDGTVVEAGSCGPDGYFNDSYGICTCTKLGRGCTYRVDIPLSDDLNDHSCHNSWVGQTGLPAMVTVEDGGPPGFGRSGVFSGYDARTNSAPHLTTYTLDGAFAGNWIFQLSFNAWFSLDERYTSGTQGIITLGDCASGSAIGIWIEDGTVQASIELMLNNSLGKVDLNGPRVTNNQWYFASVTYDSNLATDNLSLYVFTPDQYSDCRSDFSECRAAATEQASGSVTPRGCGFHVGSTGRDVPEEFFVGRICQVKVNEGYGIF